MKTKILGRVRGIDGKNFCVGATVDNVESLPNPSSVEVGTHCYVGVEAPREVYFCDGNQWINQGYLYSRDTSDIGKMVKEYINFNLSELETIDNSDMIGIMDDKSDIPDLIVGSVGNTTSSGTYYLSNFIIVDDLNDNNGNARRIFYEEGKSDITQKNNSAVIFVATGTCVLDLVLELFPESEGQLDPLEAPNRVIVLIYNRQDIASPMNYVNLSGIYCYGGADLI